ncbi:MAG: ABC transporter ATP-binding protein [Acetobacteraceae bacterium]|nr:ABC transporter ATP-binding protein [Acetobacteraceae bacterium]
MNDADTRLAALRGRPLAFLFRYMGLHPFGHAVVLIAVLLAVVCSVSTQFGMKYLIDVVSMGHDAGARLVWGAFAILCALVAADNLLWRVAGYTAHRTFVAVTGDIRRDLFAYLAGHAPGFFASRLPGGLASRVSSSANNAFTVLNTCVWSVIPPVVAVGLSIAFIGSVNLKLAAGLLALALLLGIVVFTLARRGTPLHRVYAEQAAGVDGQLVDVISNFTVMRAFGATAREQARLERTIGVEMASRRHSLYYMEHLRLIHAVLTALLTAGVVGAGINLWLRGEATVGDIVLLTSLAFTILHGTRDLAVSLVDVTQYVARLDEAIGALLLPQELPDGPGAVALPPGPREATFDDVSFAYPGRVPVIEHFNLTLAPGQRVGLVGYSGAGKSTVLSLLQRFHDVGGGRILIDGHDIRDITKASLREALALVPQDISLFHRTVRENLCYGFPDATEAQMLAAAETARCREFIEALPQGFDTMVGDRGVMLSGGQRQRLAIARALLKDAPILLLDEATSALDTESEQLIQAALDDLMKGRTVIAIAHRLSTLRRFHRIVVMDRGHIIDDGSPTVLASRPGPYRDLLDRQQMDHAAV